MLITCVVECQRAESGDDLALLHDIPSLPRLPWKLPWNEFDNGPGDAGDAVIGDFERTDSALDLHIIINKIYQININYNLIIFY